MRETEKGPTVFRAEAFGGRALDSVIREVEGKTCTKPRTPPTQKVQVRYSVNSLKGVTLGLYRGVLTIGVSKRDTRSLD